MKLTRESLDAERERARREHTPAVIKKCNTCEKIMPLEEFTKSGAKKNLCRICSIKNLTEWQKTWNRPSKTTVYSHLKSHAKSRGTRVALSRLEFESWMERELEDGVCFYCQTLLDTEKPHSLQGVTIDRIDNSLSYSIGNMVLSCRRCNIIKGSWFSFEDIIEIAQKYLTGKPF